MVAKAIKNLVRPFVPVGVKEYYELKYWKGKHQSEGTLTNDHYEYFYTTHFCVDASFYKDKVVLDIGCGPRGSLEWASMAKRRIGLDPLADKYLKLGASEHEMEYLSSPSESIPLDDDYCDAVFSFNSLDHVADLEKTIAEIKRVTRPGGTFLLLIEVNHPPTVCEPHKITPATIVRQFAPEFTANDLKVYKETIAHDIYNSIRSDAVTISDPEATTEMGFLSIRFEKKLKN